MDAREIRLEDDGGEAAAPIRTAVEGDEYERCEECGAAVDHDQRYCVLCGAHRRHINDPAARYLSQASARARAAAARSAGSPRARRRRWSSRTIAILLALVIGAAAIGVAIGRSAAGGDAALVRELAHARGQLAALRASGSTRTPRHPSSSHASAPADIQHATGKSYVQSAGALPGTVVVGGK